MSKTAITMGDPAGISPEIIIKALKDLFSVSGQYRYEDFLLIGNRGVFEKVSNDLNINVPDVEFINIDCNLSKIKKSEISEEAGRVSYLALEKACQLVNKGIVNSIATAPLSKHAINMAGYHYSGQTEILEKLLVKELSPISHRNNHAVNMKVADHYPDFENVIGKRAEMLFVCDDLRVLLLTRHIAISDISKTLSVEKIVETSLIFNNSLKKNFGIECPKIAICGLNPHCGENGLIGIEDDQIIKPALKYLNDSGINIEGPFPSDTLWAKSAKAFLNNSSQPYDGYIACYHDQGLIPVKLLAMDRAVNTTINLPVIRTSPAHGTAFDIADQYIANHTGMLEAIKLAAKYSLD